MSEPFFDRQIVAQRVELVGPGSIDAVAPQEGFGLSIGRGDGGFELRDDAAAAHDVAANRSARQAGPAASPSAVRSVVGGAQRG